MRWAFLARRLGFYLAAAAAAIGLNFLLPRLMPGDPSSAMDICRTEAPRRTEQSNRQWTHCWLRENA
jgi:ABC-type dipeptide/oligopeptide/nickel transport system permease component